MTDQTTTCPLCGAACTEDERRLVRLAAAGGSEVYFCESCYKWLMDSFEGEAWRQQDELDAAEGAELDRLENPGDFD